MILKFDKKHRIKTDRWLNISRPQWKGLFFWHNYTVVSPYDHRDCCSFYHLVTRKAEFHVAADACTFLRIALKQEFDGDPAGVVSNDVDNFPELRLE